MLEETRNPGESQEHHLKLRNLTHRDYEDVRAIMNKVYRGMGGAWERDEFIALLNRFPEGQIGIEDNGRIVAAAISLIVDYGRFGDHHSYARITADGQFTTHDPNGEILYGVDVFVDPEYRDMRLGRRLYDARKELCRKLNLRAIVAGGRIPGYHKYADEMSPEEYIELVKKKELRDPILSFQLANDFHVRRIIRNYIPDDDASRGFATILQWNNIHYEEHESPLIGQRKTTIRLGTVQWQMRRVSGLDDLMQQVEFFVDALGGYNADFAVFPELFNAPLMAEFDQSNPAQAIRGLAGYTDSICEQLQQLAVSYNINIVAGSMPVYQEPDLYNVAFLFRRDGTMDAQYKLHITPDERHYWGLKGGNELKVFDTDVGRIGILICYDCEFPELSRLLMDKGMQVLLVPFWTDTKNGYLRVRRCAQARAVENECYVAITGNVGNLPRVENADIQYSQAAVFTPSDFAFPHDGIASEATPNTEMTLIVDLDLEKLKELRNEGSVRNYRERRLDLYRVDWLGGGSGESDK
ncbi:MAG: bifunctional GNAT family N-acetyltransferase/carbon-nitrogen hydrolase family protein [Gammaproteobacteria bacterium]|jgi:predicted amidohydrolase/GNAT superfamily N-acetyltransferase